MAVNIKRGFNRMYIMLAVVWAVYCVVVYPLLRQAEATRKADQDALMCHSPEDEYTHECVDLVTQNWRVTTDQWQLRRFYSWAWGLLLVAVFVVPLAVYGSCRGAAAIAVWVWKGFRLPSQ